MQVFKGIVRGFNPRNFKMSGTGYSSLAHLFEYEDEQSQTGYKKAFSEVMETIRVTPGKAHGPSRENRQTKSQFMPFHDFFKKYDVNIDSCCAFIRRFLNHYRIIDPSSFELKIEKSVWGILVNRKKWRDQQKENGILHEGIVYDTNTEVDTDYRLFSLFNRFSKHGATLRMESAYQDVLLRLLNIEPPKSEDLSHLSGFLQYIRSCKDDFIAVFVKKAYDKYVRDILMEGRVKCQTKTISVKKGTLRAKVCK